ncbi:MAG: M14 family metallopeptidase, partial [Oxalobacter sp.]
MITTVASVYLPVDEILHIRKNRIKPDVSEGRELPRISIVTGTHGDELEGQFVCVEVLRKIQQERQYLKGIVDVYPALNPLGIDTITRGIPGFDLDMNRIFPGSTSGAVTEQVAAHIIQDLSGSDLCIDIHASNIFLKELPQIRISEATADSLLPLGKLLNMDYIWIHQASTVLESTLAHSLNSIGTPTLVVEMGVGMRITTAYTRQLVEGIFSAMKHLGIWDGDIQPVRQPIISSDGNVHFINASTAGLFVPSIPHQEHVEKGNIIG